MAFEDVEQVILSGLGDELEDQGVPYCGSSMSFLGPSDEVVRARVEFVNRANSTGAARMSLLKQLDSTQNHTKLFDFQKEAIANTVYRPSLIKVKKTVNRSGPRGDLSHSLREQVRLQNDIGTTVVNDLMAGSGKSLVTMAASIYFAMHRAQEVLSREEILIREQRSMNWSSRFGADDSKRSYTNSVIVMTSDKVVAQWEQAAKQACEVLGLRGINTSRNPTKDFLESNSENVSVLRFTSVKNLRLCFPRDDCFVPCFVVDEYVSKAKHNTATRNAEDTPVYGRLVLVSADANKTSRIMLGSRRTSLIRSAVANGEVDNTSLRNDVRLSASLMACGVLPTKTLDNAHQLILDSLNDALVEKYNINFNSPIWGALSGRFVHTAPVEMRALGIKDFEEVRTPGQLLKKIEDTMYAEDNTTVESQDSKKKRVMYLSKRVEEFLYNKDDGCLVCMDPFATETQVCLVAPCWHFVCKDCMKRCLDARHTCPKCRTDITGVVDLRMSENRVAKDVTFSSDQKFSFEDFLRAYMPQNPGSLEACCAVLEATAASLLAEIKSPILKLLVIGPCSEFSRQLQKFVQGKYRELVRIVQLKVAGNKRKRTTMGYEEQLEWFKSENDQHMVKVLCTHENVIVTEDILGLDLHGVDAICNVGGEITGRRLGRVTRIQRVVDVLENGNTGSTVRLFNLLPC